MKPICSVLLPTWRRLSRVQETIKSIVASATNPEQVEIMLRVQLDDPASISAIPELLKLAPLMRVVVGQKFRGYQDLSRFYEEIALISYGEWVWVMNDDVLVAAPGFDEKLKSIPKDRIVMPETHRLGGSRYINDLCNPFMFLPNKCWEKYWDGHFAAPFDNALWTMLRENGWQTHFMENAEIWHDRDSDAALAAARSET